MKKMKKKTRTLLLCVSGVLILCAVLAALLLTAEGEKEIDSATENHQLFTGAVNDMATAHVVNSNGEFTLHFYDSTPLTVEGFDVASDESAIKDCVNRTYEIIGRLLVAENPSDLSVYGLQTPAAHVTYTTNSGKTFGFAIGDKVSGEMGYYMIPDGSTTVYVINTNMVEPYLRSPYYYLSKSVLPTFTDTITALSISGEGMEQVNLVRIDATTDGIGNTYEYRLGSASGPLAQPGIHDKYFTGLSGLNCSQMLYHKADDAQLAACGLKDPAKVLSFTAGGKTTTLRVGNFEKDHYFLSVDGGSDVYLVTADAIPWMAITQAQIANNRSGIPAIGDLSSFVIKGAGAEYSFTVGKTADNDVAVSCNGKELLYGNVKNFYRFISLTAGETYTPNGDTKGEELCLMTFTKTDGTTHTVRFTKNGVRKVSMEVEGVCNFTLSQTYVDKILSDVTKVAAGESTTLLLS